jgi:phosphatidylinositol glycan class C protein
MYSARSYTTSNTNTTSQQDRKTKGQQRTTDAFLLVILLRFVASVLRSLTASYSSDTVQALAVAGMIVHVLACDYSYANGKEHATVVVRLQQQRPIFQGGTISLNVALFSTTLLVSRLSSNLTCYVFVTLSIVVFSFYPATRHAVAVAYHPSASRKCKVKV